MENHLSYCYLVRDVLITQSIRFTGQPAFEQRADGSLRTSTPTPIQYVVLSSTELSRASRPRRQIAYPLCPCGSRPGRASVTFDRPEVVRLEGASNRLRPKKRVCSRSCNTTQTFDLRNLLALADHYVETNVERGGVFRTASHVVLRCSGAPWRI